MPLRAPHLAAGALRINFLALPCPRARIRLTVQAGKPMTVQGDDGAGGFRNAPLALSDSGNVPKGNCGKAGFLNNPTSSLALDDRQIEAAE